MGVPPYQSCQRQSSSLWLSVPCTCCPLWPARSAQILLSTDSPVPPKCPSPRGSLSSPSHPHVLCATDRQAACGRLWLWRRGSQHGLGNSDGRAQHPAPTAARSRPSQGTATRPPRALQWPQASQCPLPSPLSPCPDDSSQDLFPSTRLALRSASTPRITRQRPHPI